MSNKKETGSVRLFTLRMILDKYSMPSKTLNRMSNPAALCSPKNAITPNRNYVIIALSAGAVRGDSTVPSATLPVLCIPYQSKRNSQKIVLFRYDSAPYPSGTTNATAADGALP
jgi:hypothetical protein